jgi:heme A synthase
MLAEPPARVKRCGSRTYGARTVVDTSECGTYDVRRSMPAPSSRFRRFARFTLAYTVAVILWGAYVRATGSGAGCGEHWPTCNGVVVPQAPSVQTLIEFTHRVTSAVSLLLVVALAWWARRAFPRGHRVRGAALGSLGFIVVEALIGAGLVLFGLVADDASGARAVVLAVHLANTFLLLGCLTLTAAWADHRAPTRRGAVFTPAGVAALAACLVVGVSGAVAALGDTIFPAGSLAEGLAQDLSPTAHLLVRLRLHHPWIALVAGLGLVAWAQRARPRHDDLARPAVAVTALVTTQLVVGATNVLLLAPVWLQLVHLLLADALWIALVVLGARLADLPATARG